MFQSAAYTCRGVEVFDDFMDENEKKAKEDRRKKRKEYVEKIKARPQLLFFLSFAPVDLAVGPCMLHCYTCQEIYTKEEKITVLSRWRDVQDALRDNEYFKWLSKLEALTSWEEWVLDTEKAELKDKTKAKYRAERKKTETPSENCSVSMEKRARSPRAPSGGTMPRSTMS